MLVIASGPGRGDEVVVNCPRNWSDGRENPRRGVYAAPGVLTGWAGAGDPGGRHAPDRVLPSVLGYQRSSWAGNPAKFFRNLTEEEQAFIPVSAEHYALHARGNLALFSHL